MDIRERHQVVAIGKKDIHSVFKREYRLELLCEAITTP
jgi:hypothetical protein